MFPQAWSNALIGGVLIGLGSMVLFWLNGRIAGNSSIIAQARPTRQRGWWRLSYVVGLLAGGLLYRLYDPQMVPIVYPHSWWIVVIAGILVGFGTRLGSGCTSGHGVCGIARLSWRSIWATVVFMVTAMITVAVVRHVGGGVWW